MLSDCWTYLQKHSNLGRNILLIVISFVQFVLILIGQAKSRKNNYNSRPTRTKIAVKTGPSVYIVNTLNGMDVNKNILKSKLPTWLRPMFKSQQTLNIDQVSAPMKEVYILRGYRMMNKPSRYYFISLFNWHNETLNVWTHLIAFMYILSHTNYLGESYDLFNTSIGAVILGYSIGALSVTFLSSVAHLFHSKSLKNHYLFFALDYMGVSLYGFGCGVLTHFCFCPLETFQMIGGVYLPVHLILCFNSFLSCTVAKIYFVQTKRKLLMISACFIHTFWLLVPIFARYYYCYIDESCPISSLNHLASMYICLSISTVSYIAHQPEKSSPGTFDICGHSHQLFHIFILCTILAQFNAMEKELSLKQTVIEDVAVGYIIKSHVGLFCVEVIALLLLIPQLNRKVREIESSEQRKEK